MLSLAMSRDKSDHGSGTRRPQNPRDETTVAFRREETWSGGARIWTIPSLRARSQTRQRGLAGSLARMRVCRNRMHEPYTKAWTVLTTYVQVFVLRTEYGYTVANDYDLCPLNCLHVHMFSVIAVHSVLVRIPAEAGVSSNLTANGGWVHVDHEPGGACRRKLSRFGWRSLGNDNSQPGGFVV
jgi:hypothetical protein